MGAGVGGVCIFPAMQDNERKVGVAPVARTTLPPVARGTTATAAAGRAATAAAPPGRAAAAAATAPPGWAAAAAGLFRGSARGQRGWGCLVLLVRHDGERC